VSFRRKLTLFFIAIVMIPMIVVGVLLVRVSEDSREGKADARIATGLETARALYEEGLDRAPAEADRVARNAASALQARDESALQRVAEAAVGDPGVESVEIAEPDGKVLVKAGPIDGLAAAETIVRGRDGDAIGTVRVTTLEADSFVARLRELTSLHAALEADRGPLGATIDLGGADLPDSSSEGGANVDLDPSEDVDEYRAAALALVGAPAGSRVALLTPRESGFVASEPLVATILLAFFAAAFVMIFLLLRNMQSRVSVMLEAARRIGQGRFDEPVPVEGHDEMAGLAVELNRMSERLRTQMRQLQRQQGELDESVKRIGEAFASGLDREAVLELVMETAVSACEAEVGRVVLHDGPGGPRTLGTGEVRDDLEPVLRAAGEMAYENHGAGLASDAERQAMGYAMVDGREHRRVLCTMSVARTGRPFSREEREVLRYLIGQTAISIENIGLHERVAEQAVTDELTGIANYRHFSDWIVREIARVERFGGELTLVLIDVDDFKAINDTYGHQQGDRVLEELGRVLRLESRGIDEAARYGGEEFVLALPETGRTSGIEVAERVRRRISRMRIPLEAEGGEPIAITVSMGVASLPGDGDDARSLMAAADRALYLAKQGGKNRVEAPPLPEADGPQGNPPIRRS
jgi:diguanylate cyclase (GGDEF)-like protein